MTRITVIGPHEARTIEQLERCVAAEEGAVGVLCADGHVGYSQPIGGAVGYRDHISPSGVGYDIGCGNKAVRTDLRVEDVLDDVPGLMDEVVQRISFGVGRRNDEPVEHPVLDAIAEADFAPQRQLRDLAAKQLGTVGAGNHYVDLFADEEGVVWVGVHFGSRGFGHKTASGFLALAQGLPFDGRAREGEMDSPPVLLAADSELGQAYIAAMTLAGAYAYAGRDVVVDRVLEILGATPVLEVHNHHNFAWRERHGEDEFWVVRKGCTPAFPGQLGFVGASMGEDAVILEGVDTPQADTALRSTVHGAGRAMSRSKAAGKLRKRWINNVRDDPTAYTSEAEALAAPEATKARKVLVRIGGAVDFPAVQRELRERRIELRGGAADEAPAAYKRLDEVLTHHADSVVIRHRLRPLGVAMAPADTFDPYKD